MFNFFVPTSASVLKQFDEMKVKLSNVVVYHQNAKLEKQKQIEVHDAEVAASIKAIAALNQFI